MGRRTWSQPCLRGKQGEKRSWMPDKKKSVLKKEVKLRDQRPRVRMRRQRKSPMRRRTCTRRQRRSSSASSKPRRRSNQRQAKTLPRWKKLETTRLLKRLQQRRKLHRETETLNDQLIELKMAQ